MASSYHERMREILHKIFPYYNIDEERSMFDKNVTRDRRAKRLHVDFFIRELKVAIEVDGEHHFRKVDYTKDDEAAQNRFLRRIALDREKNRIAKENGWKIIRVHHEEFDDEDELVQKLRKEVHEVI